MVAAGLLRLVSTALPHRISRRPYRLVDFLTSPFFWHWPGSLDQSDGTGGAFSNLFGGVARNGLNTPSRRGPFFVPFCGLNNPRICMGPRNGEGAHFRLIPIATTIEGDLLEVCRPVLL